MARYPWRAYVTPRGQLLAHVWVHNGPLWRVCSDCRATRREAPWPWLVGASRRQRVLHYLGWWP